MDRTENRHGLRSRDAGGMGTRWSPSRFADRGMNGVLTSQVIQSATKQSAGSATPMRIELRRKRRIRTLGQHCGRVSVWTGKCSATARQDNIKREWPQVCATPILPVQVGTLCLPRSDEIVRHFPRTGGCHHCARGSNELNDWSSRKLACGGRLIGQSQRAFAQFRRLISVQCRSRQQKRISVARLSTNRGTGCRTRRRGTWRWSLNGSRSCRRDAQARRGGSIHPRRFSQPEPNAECDSHCQSSNERPRCIAMHHQSVPRRTSELTLTAPESFRNPFNSPPGSDESMKISAAALHGIGVSSSPKWRFGIADRRLRSTAWLLLVSRSGASVADTRRIQGVIAMALS